jgi:energy-converting hydrogenase Eha subunit C
VKEHGADTFRLHAGLSAVVAVVGLAGAVLVPRVPEARLAAVIGVTLAAVTGAVGLVLKRRALRKDLNAALKVVGVVFGMRAVGVVVGLLWVVERGLGAVAFVAGFFGTYFALQWIEVSYVMAASRGAAGGDE